MAKNSLCGHEFLHGQRVRHPEEGLAIASWMMEPKCLFEAEDGHK
jgi:hypothetical protein